MSAKAEVLAAKQLSMDSEAASLLEQRKQKRLEDAELDRRGQATVDEWTSERHGDDPLRKREYTVCAAPEVRMHRKFDFYYNRGTGGVRGEGAV